VIGCKGVTVDAGGSRLLQGVDLEVARGEWLCVLGPNGAGKSTLVRALAGLVPHGGRVRLAGADASGLRPRARARLVALVPQSPVVPPGLPVVDYVLLGRTPHIPAFGTERAEDHAVVERVMARLDLLTFRQRRLDSLSGGERQRVVLARSLVQETPVLLLDEPTTSLDIGHQQEVLDLVDDLRHEHDLTVLSTMHDLTLAGQYADRLVLLARGRVVAEGKAHEVLDEDLLREHYGVSVRVVRDEDGVAIVPRRGRSPARRGTQLSE
jgi:iron complex transport system ATP-binding protein